MSFAPHDENAISRTTSPIQQDVGRMHETLEATESLTIRLLHIATECVQSYGTNGYKEATNKLEQAICELSDSMNVLHEQLTTIQSRVGQLNRYAVAVGTADAPEVVTVDKESFITSPSTSIWPSTAASESRPTRG